jgi:hypothetical protein
MMIRFLALFLFVASSAFAGSEDSNEEQLVAFLTEIEDGLNDFDMSDPDAECISFALHEARLAVDQLKQARGKGNSSKEDLNALIENASRKIDLLKKYCEMRRRNREKDLGRVETSGSCGEVIVNLTCHSKRRQLGEIPSEDLLPLPPIGTEVNFHHADSIWVGGRPTGSETQTILQGSLP